MTRNGAIKILSRIWGGNPQHDLASSYADAFVALGMLKLDEPKSPNEAFDEIGRCYNLSLPECVGFRSMLNRAGLKVVEK